MHGGAARVNSNPSTTGAILLARRHELPLSRRVLGLPGEIRARSRVSEQGIEDVALAVHHDEHPDLDTAADRIQGTARGWWGLGMTYRR